MKSTIAFLSLLMVVAAARAAEPVPGKAYSGAAILTEMPKELQEAQLKDWGPIHDAYFTEWASKNLVGKRYSEDASYERGGVSGPELSLTVTTTVTVRLKLPMKVTLTVRCPASESTRVMALKKSQQSKVSGVIEKVVREGEGINVTLLGGSFSGGPVMAPPAPNPAPVPAVAPAVRPADPVAGALFDLRAGKADAALAAIAAFEKANKRPPGKLTDPKWINALHIQGVAYMKLGQGQRAAAVLEPLYVSAVPDRTRTINLATCDIINKKTAMRAVKSLKSHVTAQPEDEQAVILWGVALDTASTAFKVVGLDAYADEYVKACALLEGPKGGWRLWGTKWISPAEYANIERQREDVRRQCDAKQQALDRSLASLQDAKNYYASVNRVRFGMSQAEASRRNSAAQSVQSAQREVDRDRAELKRVQATTPRPTWTSKLDPLMPELLK